MPVDVGAKPQSTPGPSAPSHIRLTSHASVDVMLALEDHFGLEFPERYLQRATFESVANLTDALDELLGSE